MQIVSFYRRIIGTPPVIKTQIELFYPYPATFLVTWEAMESCSKQVVEITIWSLIIHVLKYSVKHLWFKGLVGLRFAGFLTTKDGCCLSIKDFTLKFWKHKLKRIKV